MKGPEAGKDERELEHAQEVSLTQYLTENARINHDRRVATYGTVYPERSVKARPKDSQSSLNDIFGEPCLRDGPPQE